MVYRICHLPPKKKILDMPLSWSLLICIHLLMCRLKMALIDWHWKSLERNSFWLSFTVFLQVYTSNRPVFQLSVYHKIKKHLAFSLLLLFCSLKAQKCVSGLNSFIVLRDFISYGCVGKSFSKTKAIKYNRKCIYYARVYSRWNVVKYFNALH